MPSELFTLDNELVVRIKIGQKWRSVVFFEVCAGVRFSVWRSNNEDYEFRAQTDTAFARWHEPGSTDDHFAPLAAISEIVCADSEESASWSDRLADKKRVDEWKRRREQEEWKAVDAQLKAEGR